MKLCPQCEKENPSKANHCMHCGSPLNEGENIDQIDKLHREPEETRNSIQLLKPELDSHLNKEEGGTGNKTEKAAEKNFLPPPPPVVTPPPPPVNKPFVLPSARQPKSYKKAIFVIAGLVLIAGIVFGFFYYNNVYIPEKTDREADRYYTFAEKTNLRSTNEVGYNRIRSLDYGSELITYSHNDNGWSKVKDRSGQEGYISSDLLLSKDDFSILNGIFDDIDSRECINLTRYRLALLDYYKKNGLDNNWKVHCHPQGTKPNSVFFSKLYNKNAKYSDFAVIITNNVNNSRKMVIFGFDDNGNVSRINDGYAEGKYINNIYVNSYGAIYVDFSN